MLNVSKQQNKIPVFYAYIIAYEIKARMWPTVVVDCDQNGTLNLCIVGSDFIRNNTDYLVSRYLYQASNIAKIIGSSAKCIFLIEPDFWYG